MDFRAKRAASPGTPSLDSEPHLERFNFWRTWIFSTDHKTIGIQYGVTAGFFTLFGFGLVLMMRWQLAYPGESFPVLDRVLGPENAFMPSGAIVPEFYNALGAMHGTIMVFLAIVPMLVGAFGNFLVPLQIGAPDMAFPRLNRASYWFYIAGGVIMLSGFVLPGGPANSGWTSYPPLSVIAKDAPGQTVWLVGMGALIISSLLGAINMIVTVVQLRVTGLSLMRMPYFVWCQLIAAFLSLLAFPPLAAAAVLQLSDRLADTSFFLPTGLMVSGEPVMAAGGGSALLWQHLFWFLGHPEVYVLILPAMGIVAEVIANNTRRPLWGYRPMVYSALFVGFMSFTVWAHHMFLTGMGTTINAFFEITTMVISIPSVVILTALIGSLWGGSIRFNTPMLFALAFLPMFGLGGLTGLPLGLAASDLHLHDTAYVIGHFHYVVAPGTLFGLFAGVYHWYPKVTGRKLSDWLGQIHFWPSLVLMNGIFLPMLVQGLAGVSRRLYDGGATYAFAQDVLALNKVMTHSAYALAVVQIPFIVNVVWSLRQGERAKDNTWQATTLEWAAPSPPLGHGNFETAPRVVRGPYEYSVPGHSSDYTPQWDQGGS